jgi:putative heme iron utilization protein
MVLQEPDEEVFRLAKSLIHCARHGALAALDPSTGVPLASRVGVSTDIDGTPVILISRLARHTAALLADGRCSLLLGEPGAGDPLAHPRLSIEAKAVEIERGSAEHTRIEGRYLRHQPKAKLYAGLGDFRYFRLEPAGASFNGGFGRAYELTADDILTLSEANDALAESEASSIEHMNADHADAVENYARFFAKTGPGRWILTGIDAEGIDIANSDDTRRVFFDAPVASPHDVHMTLVAMARKARTALAAEA